MNSYTYTNGHTYSDRVTVLAPDIDSAESSLLEVTPQTKQQRLFSITKPHAYGKAYCHIPTGTRVFIGGNYGLNQTLYYTVHRMGISGNLHCQHDTLRPWGYGDIDYRVDIGPGKNPVPFSNLSEAITYAVKVNGDLLVFSEKDNMYKPVANP